MGFYSNNEYKKYYFYYDYYNCNYYNSFSFSCNDIVRGGVPVNPSTCPTPTVGVIRVISIKSPCVCVCVWLFMFFGLWCLNTLKDLRLSLFLRIERVCKTECICHYNFDTSFLSFYSWRCINHVNHVKNTEESLSEKKPNGKERKSIRGIPFHNSREYFEQLKETYIITNEYNESSTLKYFLTL